MEPSLRRLDLQLLAMIDDARGILEKRGYKTNRKVLMTGFSASGMFATRFALLHPELIHALAAGGVNGFVVLPIGELDGQDLA